MRPRLGPMLGVLVLSAAAIGCSAANPSLQPSDAVSQGPTPTDLTPPPPTVGPNCPTAPPDLASIVALDPGQRLACFGRAALTFQATAVGPGEVECGSIQVDPAWLWCPPAAFLTPPGPAAFWPGSDPVAFVGPDLPMLEVYTPPGVGVGQAQFFHGAIIFVTGHFDDPAAAACRIVAQREPELHVPTAAEVVLHCRETFVVTSVQRGAA